MNVMECIEKYVDQIDTRIPIFVIDIQNYIKECLGDIKNNVINEYITRYAKKHQEFRRYRRGIYFKTVITPFGLAKINFAELVKRVYLTDGIEIFGYETGPSYMNKIGLTTQVPNRLYIATNHSRFDIKIKQEICVIRPIVTVEKSNYRYLQLLDILDNRFNIKFEIDNYEDILRKEIKEFQLDFETLAVYAKYYKSNSVNRKLIELAS